MNGSALVRCDLALTALRVALADVGKAETACDDEKLADTADKVEIIRHRLETLCGDLAEACRYAGREYDELRHIEREARWDTHEP